MNTVFFVNGGSRKNNEQLAETDINAGFSLNVIADELNLDVNRLMSWNPGISEQLQNKGEGTLYLPKDIMPDFLLRKTRILSRSIKETNTPNTKQ
jgi:membrane-bound lytic murein transglycosylase D